MKPLLPGREKVGAALPAHLNGMEEPMHFTPIPTSIVRAYQSDGADANGQQPERQLSDGEGDRKSVV